MEKHSWKKHYKNERSMLGDKINRLRRYLSNLYHKEGKVNLKVLVFSQILDKMVLEYLIQESELKEDNDDTSDFIIDRINMF